MGLASSGHGKLGDMHVASALSGRLVSFRRANGKSSNGQCCHCGNVTGVEREKLEQVRLGGDIRNRREWVGLG